MSEPVVHRLKTIYRYWDAVARGDKTFEVRKDDRGFQTGDILELVRCDEDGQYSHDALVMRRRVSYILRGGQFGIEVGYVVIGLREV